MILINNQFPSEKCFRTTIICKVDSFTTNLVTWSIIQFKTITLIFLKINSSKTWNIWMDLMKIPIFSGQTQIWDINLI